ncbi:hypothetical protein QE152_g37608 [Popillia japonica]|uniref:Uncharacterized protein n=1 Tax=Popillia japonica TaxID=7064 RepID=A0AAW1IA08_POPJA
MYLNYWEFPEIRAKTIYGRKSVEAIRDIPSDSEDSELSDRELDFHENRDETWEPREIDALDDCVPLSQLFHLPPGTRLYFPKYENII